ncbi:MAG: hypothetical protein SGBAC_011048 [Bacillariaceae sp.]
MNVLKSVLLFLALFVATSAAEGMPYDISETPDSTGVASNAQKLPCTLFIRETDYTDGTDGSDWECKVSAKDAMSAGAPSTATSAMVDIVGIEIVLQANDAIQSGVTTLFAEGALLADRTLTIVDTNTLTFGEVASGASRRKLSANIGPLNVLVVRVTTNDGSLTKDAAGISDDLFGTGTDLVNFKSQAEACSNNAVTITPGTGFGTGCDSDAGYSAGTTTTGEAADCDWYENQMEQSNNRDECSSAVYGDFVDVNGSGKDARAACCVCGGGTPQVYDNSAIMSNGVIDISVNVNANGLNRFDLEDLVENQLEDLFHVTDMSTKFDNVLMCVPEGTFRPSDNSVGWIAYAYVGGWLSVYNGDDQCNDPSTHLHEVGHNWGLQHASDENDCIEDRLGNGYCNIEYGDMTGVMGYSRGRLDDEIFGNKYCFGGAHSWQLGWYTEYDEEIDPLTTAYTGKLAGVGKLPNLDADEKIVLKLAFSIQDYYVMYNHAIGANEGTVEGVNTVTITSKEANSQAKTFLLAELESGGWFTAQTSANVPLFTVYVTSIDDSDDGSAQIEVFPGGFEDRPAMNTSTTPGSNGDPHFKTWKNEHYEYHGQCDMILVKDPEFANGVGMEIQIRTKLVRHWSYIKNVAIRIGNDILEIEGSADMEEEFRYWYNLEYRSEMQTLGGFPIILKKREYSHYKRGLEIDLDSIFPGEKIEVSAWKEFVRVDFKNASAASFGKSVGLLGDFSTGKTLGRDGVTVHDDFFRFGNEWQVLPYEDMMFHIVEQPQFPKSCILPEDPQGQLHRRLDESSVLEEDAEKACANLKDELDRKDCVYDILATQDLDMAGAY